MTRDARVGVLLVSLCMGGCGPASSTSPDAGSDAARVDAATPVDAAAPMDAVVAMDANTPHDGGETGDTGVGEEASIGSDGGGSDAGDSGAGDSGAGEDASVDAGALADGGGPVALGTCAAPRAIALVEGMQSVSGDTRGGAIGEIDPGGCGDESAPADVIALTMPAGGPWAVELSTANDGTDPGFDTLLLVRDACDVAQDFRCIDEAGDEDSRSRGAAGGTGGETVFVIVTGFDASASGPYRLDIHLEPASAPTAMSATAVVARPFLVASVQGMDPNGDVATMGMELLDETGAPLGLFHRSRPPDGVLETTVYETLLSEPLDGATEYGAVARYGISREWEFDRATHARLYVRDLVGLRSEALTVPITGM